MEQTTLEVRGMACEGCEGTVRDAVGALDGVAEVTADRETDEVRVEHDEALVDRAGIGGAIEDAGYDVVG